MNLKDKRIETLRQAIACLSAAEIALDHLVSSYSEEQDEKFSAAHPRNGHVSTLTQVKRIRKALLSARV